jgi:hypothetical protein
VSSSAGFGFTVTYSSDTFPQSGWWQKTGVTFTNAVTACDSSCPSLAYGGTGGSIASIADGLGRQWSFTVSSGRLTGIRRPGTSSDTTLTQTSYDSVGRPICTAQRMNPAAFGSLPSDACTLGTQGSYGPDRISVTTYERAATGQAFSGMGSQEEHMNDERLLFADLLRRFVSGDIGDWEFDDFVSFPQKTESWKYTEER